MKYYDFSKLNRHAMAVLAYMNDTCKGMKVGESKEIPLAMECNSVGADGKPLDIGADGAILVAGAEFSSSDIILLNGTYSKWRIGNGLQPVLFELHLNNSTTIGEVSSTMYYTMTVSVCEPNTIGDSLFAELELDDDIPKGLKKRDGKAEKAKTAENNAKKADDAKKVADAEKVLAEVSADAEIKNEEKALKASADKFNAEVEKDLADIEKAELTKSAIESTVKRIALIFGNATKEQKKAVADALKDLLKEVQ